MVIAPRKFAVLPVEAVLTDVVNAGGAAAISAPIAHGAEYVVQDHVLRVDRAALAHGHVVRRVKARGADIAYGACEAGLAVQGISAAERIAVVLDEPKPVRVTESLHRLQVKGVAERVRNHHGLGLIGERCLKLGHIDVVLRNADVHKDRNRAVLDDGRDRGREAAGHGDHFIAALHPALAELRGGQRHEGEEVRARTRVYERHIGDAQVLAELLLKEIAVATGGQPELQDGIRRIHHLLVVVDAGRVGNAVARLKGLFLLAVARRILFHQRQYLLPRLCFCLIFKHASFSLPSLPGRVSALPELF